MPNNSIDNNKEFIERQKQIYKSAYVTIAFVIINVVIYMLSNTLAKDLYSYGVLITEAVVQGGQLYRIITATFLHADINHLFNNMIILVLVGALIENYVGHLQYFFIYLLAGCVGNLTSMAYEVAHKLTWVSLGASGAVMGLVGFLMVWVLVNRRILITEKTMLIRLVLLFLFVVESCFFQKGVNTAAHFGGFFIGFMVGLVHIITFNNNKDMEGIA